MISVVVPCFNSQQTIVRALSSIYHQTYKNYDIIIVDDGSVDNTKGVVESFFKNKKIKYKYIYQENTGPSSARNNGVQNSDSEYIAFLDSDDEWHYKKLEIQIKAIEENSLLFLGSIYTYDDFIYEKNEEIELSKYTFEKLIFSNKFSTPGVIIKKSFYLQLKGFDNSMKYAEDYDLWLRASLQVDLNLIVNPKLFKLYKKAYGASGLSSHMYPMYKGELYTLKKLKKGGDLNYIKYVVVNILVTLKFVKRLCVYTLRKR
jgi:glycosyltransferase involved in cell wall biosynthesis